MSIKEFLGLDGYLREAEGYMSVEHLTFVTGLVVIMILAAVTLGTKYRDASDKKKNRVLIVCAILINSFEIFKIIIMCIRGNDPFAWLLELPLFLCSIQLITIPMAAFSKGRFKEASLDFITIFGILGAILGTYFAGNNYSVYPVISIDNVFSGITHTISGFTSLYIVISGLASMKKKNIPICMSILTAFSIAAYIANALLDYNYMFLRGGDGTPYEIVYRLVGGNQVLYPLCVVALFFIYIALYYYIFYALKKNKNKPVSSSDTPVSKEEDVKEPELIK